MSQGSALVANLPAKKHAAGQAVLTAAEAWAKAIDTGGVPGLSIAGAAAAMPARAELFEASIAYGRVCRELEVAEEWAKRFEGAPEAAATQAKDE